jgi:hypothetical protein
LLLLLLLLLQLLQQQLLLLHLGALWELVAVVGKWVIDMWQIEWNSCDYFIGQWQWVTAAHGSIGIIIVANPLHATLLPLFVVIVVIVIILFIHDALFAILLPYDMLSDTLLPLLVVIIVLVIIVFVDAMLFTTLLPHDVLLATPLPLLIIIVVAVIVVIINNTLFATLLPLLIVILDVFIVIIVNDVLFVTLLPHDALFAILLPFIIAIVVVVIVVTIFGIIIPWFGGYGSCWPAAFLPPCFSSPSSLPFSPFLCPSLLSSLSSSSLETSAILAALAPAVVEIHDLLSSPLWSWVKYVGGQRALSGWKQQELGRVATTPPADPLELVSVETMGQRGVFSFFAMVVNPNCVIWGHTNWSGRWEVTKNFGFTSQVSDTATYWMSLRCKEEENSRRNAGK